MPLGNSGQHPQSAEFTPDRVFVFWDKTCLWCPPKISSGPSLGAKQNELMDAVLDGNKPQCGLLAAYSSSHLRGQRCWQCLRLISMRFFGGEMLKSSTISVASGGHEFFLCDDTAAGDAGFSASFPKCRALTMGRKGRSSYG